MTLSTSAVAVCCCRDSRSSFSSRAFSIAITACAAKLLNQLDLFVGERANLLTIDDDRADQLVVLNHRYSDARSRAAELRRNAGFGILGGVVGVTYLFGLQHATEKVWPG